MVVKAVGMIAICILHSHYKDINPATPCGYKFIFQEANLKQKEYEQRVIGYVRDISKFCLADIEIVCFQCH
jgi:hypothetical protein